MEEELKHIKPEKENMQIHLPNEQGHVPVPGHYAVYPQGYRVFFLHDEFAGMEPPETMADASAEQPDSKTGKEA